MLFRKINDNLSPHVILSFIGTADSAYYCKMQDEETCCAKCSWCSILDVFSNWVNTRTSSQARKKDENMCRYNVYWLVLLQRACKPSLSACLKISLCSSENLARFKGSMALMSHNVVPVVLLGDRNEAHDNVPGWVPLRVSYCYGNGTSSPFFFLFYHSLKLLFFFSFFSLAFPAVFHLIIRKKYMRPCHTAPLCFLSHANSGVYGWETKEHQSGDFSYSCVFQLFSLDWLIFGPRWLSRWSGMKGDRTSNRQLGRCGVQGQLSFKASITGCGNCPSVTNPLLSNGNQFSF